MKEVLINIVAMFLLIVCCVIQIIALMFQFVSLATGYVRAWLKALGDKLMDVYGRLRGKTIKNDIPEAA